MGTIWLRIARRMWTCTDCGGTIFKGHEYLQIGKERICVGCPTHSR